MTRLFSEKKWVKLPFTPKQVQKAKRTRVKLRASVAAAIASAASSSNPSAIGGTRASGSHSGSYAVSDSALTGEAP